MRAVSRPSVYSGLWVTLAFVACGGPNFYGSSDDGDDSDFGDGATWDLSDDGMPSFSDELFDPTFVPTFELEIAEEEWDTLTEDPNAKVYVRANFTYRDRGEVLENVGVHFQGGYSLVNVHNGKYGFTVSFPEFEPGRLWRGLRHLKLKMPGFDPSLLVEPIAYGVYREAGVLAPRANHARLFVNGDYYGVYVHVEDVDQSFLSRRFVEDQGDLFKMADGAWSEDFLAPGATGQELVWRFHPETNEANASFDALTELLDAWNDSDLDSFVSRIEPLVDVDLVLLQIACDLALGNWDGISTAAWNFYLYEDVVTGLFVPVPFGPDASFEREYDVWSAPQPSAQKLIEAFPDRYSAALEFLAERVLLPDRLEDQIDADYERIREYEEDDWRNVNEFEAEVPLVRDAANARAVALTAQLEAPRDPED